MEELHATGASAQKLTADEMKTIVAAAEAQRKSPSEWARGVLLHAAHNGISEAISTHMFTELVAVQLVIMNALDPLLREEKLTRDQVLGIFREVQATKGKRAQELLAKRAQQR
jgi:hypothetical protein